MPIMVFAASAATSFSIVYVSIIDNHQWRCPQSPVPMMVLAASAEMSFDSPKSAILTACHQPAARRCLWLAAAALRVWWGGGFDCGVGGAQVKRKQCSGRSQYTQCRQLQAVAGSAVAPQLEEAVCSGAAAPSSPAGPPSTVGFLSPRATTVRAPVSAPQPN